MERDPRDLVPREGLDHLPRPEDRLVPRELELDRYQIPQV